MSAIPFKAYYQLAKPGIIYGNCINALAGFFLAAAGDADWLLLGAVLAGTSLVIASGCVFNNYIDQDIDLKMERTKGRPLQTGAISGRSALIYATVLAAAGFTVLLLGTNLLTVGLGVLALFSYVVVYGYAKRRTVYGTIVGSVPGALSPVAAYAAVSGQLDEGALLLFLIMAIWQIPHFYAITMYRRDEYTAAGLPVLAVVKGLKAARRQVSAYIVLLLLVAPLLTVYGYTGIVYVVSASGLIAFWLFRGLYVYRAKPDAAWGRSMFFTSLIVTLGLAVCLALGPLLP